MGAFWRIELLGGIRAVGRGRTVQRFRSQKTAALLAYLALHSGRPIPREILVELLWPDGGLDAGRNNLSTSLSSLRQELEGDVVPPGAVIRADRLMVELRGDAVRTDVADFELAVEAAGRLVNRSEQARLLSEALAHYRGELLPGQYESWIHTEQQRLQELCLAAHGRLIGCLKELGRLDEALATALRAVTLDPLREESHLEVIRVYDRLGQPAAAMRQYRELERMLRVELDARPSAAAAALATRIGGLATVKAELPAGAGQRSAVPSRAWEASGGALPLDSPFYVTRRADRELGLAISQRRSIVLLKGARQTGKSSALARGLNGARSADSRVVLTDLDALSAEDLGSVERLFLTLAQWIVDQLGVEFSPRDGWDELRGPALNFSRLVRRVLRAADTDLIWALDRADRLFGFPFGTEVFALFRAWHNERALSPAGPWSQLSLVISYAAEAHLLITDVNQSPFNVGTRVELADFDPAQIADLSARYELSLSGDELRDLRGLLGGHPYLIQRALQSLAAGGGNLRRQPDTWDRPDGPFGQHLSRMAASVAASPDLVTAVRTALEGKVAPADDAFYRLKSAGILSGDTPERARLRCQLYETYLRRQLS